MDYSVQNTTKLIIHPKITLAVICLFFVVLSFLSVYHFLQERQIAMYAASIAFQVAKEKDFYAATQKLNTLLIKGQYQEGLRESKKAIELATKMEEQAIVHYWIGVMYYKLDQTDNAEKELRVATKLYTIYAAPYVVLSSINFYKGESQQALAYAQKAITLDPTYPSAYNSLGLAYFALGKKQEAINAIKKAIALDPKSEVFQTNLLGMEEASF